MALDVGVGCPHQDRREGPLVLVASCPLTWRATPASYMPLVKQGLRALAPRWPWAGPALLRASVYQAGRAVTTPQGVEKAGSLQSRCVQPRWGLTAVCVFVTDSHGCSQTLTPSSSKPASSTPVGLSQHKEPGTCRLVSLVQTVNLLRPRTQGEPAALTLGRWRHRPA